MAEVYEPTAHREKRRRPRFRWWNRFVMLVGYAAILYETARGIIYLLVLIGGNA